MAMTSCSIELTASPSWLVNEGRDMIIEPHRRRRACSRREGYRRLSSLPKVLFHVTIEMLIILRRVLRNPAAMRGSRCKRIWLSLRGNRSIALQTSFHMFTTCASSEIVFSYFLLQFTRTYLTMKISYWLLFCLHLLARIFDPNAYYFLGFSQVNGKMRG